MKRSLAFTALLAWCGALILIRFYRSNSVAYAFLLWNLFLAAVPYAVSILMQSLDRVRRFHILQWCAFAVWLLFLPNAPYIVTDFIHLRPRNGIPLWYDVLLLLSCAGTGLLLGYSSVMIVQRIAARRLGVAAGWLLSVVSLILSAFGIYLGRFVRFNSWDALTDPVPLFADIAQRIANPTAHPRTFIVTGLFGVALTLGYVALYAVAVTLGDEEDRPLRAPRLGAGITNAD